MQVTASQFLDWILAKKLTIAIPDLVRLYPAHFQVGHLLGAVVGFLEPMGCCCVQVSVVLEGLEDHFREAVLHTVLM